ncbi:MAG: OsmC family protein [Bryobacteraceae bacterium]
MSDVASQYTIGVDQIEAFQFRVQFDKPQYGQLMLDEPPPLGQDTAPSAGRVLAAAIGDCLSASFVFAAKKNGLEIAGMHADVTVEIVRNERRRFRIGRILVALNPNVSEADAAKASVRQGIPVEVAVKGAELPGGASL